MNWGALSIIAGLFALAAAAPVVGIPLLALAALLFIPWRK